ncbi:serine/threonine-protein kinase [Deinococcus arenicola]|uniref:Serine/threonine-protein kinase n=1 Tax=Deinococcus arenicola TaxID=2994950 RepID=A0ABU4DTS1_9DEIO|nr:serine/threonine-protein kinase [Deinococcus sp. ZS9-10]MDV6375820.1 serine/threonine-protein kinase [Deinococcus sp. ZS9-10]
MTEPKTQAIAGYTLHRTLGRGNTSLVRLAMDPDGRQVALKLPHEETLRVQDAAERFGNEVRLTMQFRHPHVIRGYAGTAFGPGAFLAIQYYPDGPLNEQLARLPGRTLPLSAALRVLADLASALAYLHHLGAVHQDLKTHNVYVDEHGRASLGDLGNTYFVAQGGRVSGSPYYMAPEIYHGESSSSASDVYSLGILMYELLSGDRPYQGNSYDELMVAHMTRFPAPLIHLNPTVSRQVSRLAEQALSKRPGERPRADAIRRALLSDLGETPQDEVYEKSGVDTAPGVEKVTLVGRHGPAQTRTPRPPTESDSKAESKPTPERSGNWNPFKRRK